MKESILLPGFVPKQGECQPRFVTRVRRGTPRGAPSGVADRCWRSPGGSVRRPGGCTSRGQSCDRWRTAGPGLVTRAPRLIVLNAEPSDLLTLAMLPDGAAAFRALRDREPLEQAVSHPDEHADVLRPALRRLLRSGEARRAAEEELGRTRRAGVRLVAFGEPDYPALLTRIYAPPPILWVRGQPIDPGNSREVAMVGSRAASAVGARAGSAHGRGPGARRGECDLWLRPGHRHRRPSRRTGGFWAHRGGARQRRRPDLPGRERSPRRAAVGARGDRLGAAVGRAASRPELPSSQSHHRGLVPWPRRRRGRRAQWSPHHGALCAGGGSRGDGRSPAPGLSPWRRVERADPGRRAPGARWRRRGARARLGARPERRRKRQPAGLVAGPCAGHAGTN